MPTYRTVHELTDDETTRHAVDMAGRQAIARAWELGLHITGEFVWFFTDRQLVGLAPARWLADIRLKAVAREDADELVHSVLLGTFPWRDLVYDSDRLAVVRVLLGRGMTVTAMAAFLHTSKPVLNKLVELLGVDAEVAA